MIRVLHVIGKRPTGGIGTVVKNYQRHINKEECVFDYLIFDDEPSGDFDEYVMALGSKVYVLPELKNKRLFSINNKIKDFFLKTGYCYDIVHLHSANIGFMVFRYAKMVGIKIRIIYSHATKYSDKKINSVRNYFLYKPTNKLANNYFYCSNLARQFLFNNVNINLYFMHNAIECEKYKYNES